METSEIIAVHEIIWSNPNVMVTVVFIANVESLHFTFHCWSSVFVQWDDADNWTKIVSLLPLFEDLENGVVDAMRFQVDFMSCLCGVNGFEENFTFHKLNILWLHYYFALPVMINYFFLLLCSDMVFNSSSLLMSISNLILN